MRDFIRDINPALNFALLKSKISARIAQGKVECRVNPWAVLVVLAFILWCAISWRWYTCGIKGFCGDTNIPNVYVTAILVSNDQESCSRMQNEARAQNGKRCINNTASDILGEATKLCTDCTIPEGCTPYIVHPIGVNSSNRKEDVRRLERFLNRFEGTDLAEDGLYGASDMVAVKHFQKKYRHEILEPYGLKSPTGRVHTKTRSVINLLVCEYYSQKQ